MADDPKRNRFIPFRKADIVNMCIDESSWATGQAEQFREFYRILDALFHFEFHRNLETLKNCYAPFNPDADTRLLTPHTPEEKRKLQKELVTELTAVLNAANFEQVTAGDLEQALTEESLFKIRLEVDFNDFDDALKKLERLKLVTRRGSALQCLPLTDAIKQLDHIWDNYFTFS